MNDETLQTKNKNRSKLTFNKYLVNETQYCTERTSNLLEKKREKEEEDSVLLIIYLRSRSPFNFFAISSIIERTIRSARNGVNVVSSKCFKKASLFCSSTSVKNSRNNLTSVDRSSNNGLSLTYRVNAVFAFSISILNAHKVALDKINHRKTKSFAISNYLSQ